MDANPAAASLQFVDRGDPAANDFTSTNFTKDNAYHDLDLSAIVGVNACLVLIAVTLRATTTNEEMRLKEKGNSNDINVVHRKMTPSGETVGYDVWVQTDANGVIEYKFTVGTWSTINFNVRGWLI